MPTAQSQGGPQPVFIYRGQKIPSHPGGAPDLGTAFVKGRLIRLPSGLGLVMDAAEGLVIGEAF